jgi:hypothetical protein
MLHVYNNSHSLSSLENKEQEISRSNHQLYRYNHEPVSSNFLRRDIPPILILLFFLFLIIITLSQILVVHTSRYGANFSTMQKIQEELKLMDDSMEVLLRDHVLPIEKWRLLFHIQTYLYRFEYLFQLFNNDSNLIKNNLLFNKSNQILLKENMNYQLRKEYSQWKQRKIENKKKKRKRNYCREEPRFLRKFKKNEK